MKNKNSNTLMLLTGIVAGAAAVYFLNTPKGKAILDIVVQKGEDLNDQLQDQVEAAIVKGKETIDKTKEEAKAAIENVGNEVISGNEIAQKVVNDTLNDFHKGVEQAKAKLKNA